MSPRTMVQISYKNTLNLQLLYKTKFFLDFWMNGNSLFVTSTHVGTSRPYDLANIDIKLLQHIGEVASGQTVFNSIQFNLLYSYTPSTYTVANLISLGSNYGIRTLYNI